MYPWRKPKYLRLQVISLLQLRDSFYQFTLIHTLIKLQGSTSFPFFTALMWLLQSPFFYQCHVIISMLCSRITWLCNICFFSMIRWLTCDSHTSNPGVSLMIFSQFGFYDNNETVVEMQHQDVSENHTTDTHIQHWFWFISTPFVIITNTLILFWIIFIYR